MEKNGNNVAANIWTARVIPVILAAVVGYATYVLVVPLCVDYLLKKHNDKSAAIPILVIYFVLFLLMASSFLRLLYVTVVDPPYVPLGPSAIRDKKKPKRTAPRSKTDDIGGAEYSNETDLGHLEGGSAGLNNDPDSPGLELFYTKDVFVCEADGKPRWCSECMNWKPDRTHHCSSSERCIRRMDHFCPWVGGPVGENNFKFFTQFTGYTALYTLHLLVVMTIYISKQHTNQNESINSQFIAILALSGFFFLFTAGMTGTSFELILRNLTQVERLGIKTRLQTLAVLVPPRERLFEISPDLASNPTYYEITYPLDNGQAPLQEQGYRPEGRPKAKSYVHAHRSITSRDIHIHRPVSATSQVPIVLGSNSTEETLHVSDSELGGGPEVTRDDDTNALPVEDTKNPQPLKQNHRRELLSERDRRATRTFAILSLLNVGDNPWDLGSAIANWQSVMGYNLVDYLLPIRRSPCCNHEPIESHYRIGPAVDQLRSSVGFSAAEDMLERGHRLKKPKDNNTQEMRKRSHRTARTDERENNHLGQPDGSTELRHLR